MHMILEEVSKITDKGQTTVPKAVRQALGVDCGGRVAYRIEDGQVTVHNPDAEDFDPALDAFLSLIENDISAGRNLHCLPTNLFNELSRVMKNVEVDLGETLKGDVSL